MDSVAILKKQRYTKDEIGQYKTNRTEDVEILVRQGSITRAEWSAAGKNGFHPEIVLSTAKINYGGESEVEFEGERYSIYRTYSPPDSDDIELYLEKKTGVQNG